MWTHQSSMLCLEILGWYLLFLIEKKKQPINYCNPLVISENLYTQKTVVNMSAEFNWINTLW